MASIHVSMPHPWYGTSCWLPDPALDEISAPAPWHVAWATLSCGREHYFIEAIISSDGSRTGP